MGSDDGQASGPLSGAENVIADFESAHLNNFIDRRDLCVWKDGFLCLPGRFPPCDLLRRETASLE